jgi:hypothetical protein
MTAQILGNAFREKLFDESYEVECPIIGNVFFRHIVSLHTCHSSTML